MKASFPSLLGSLLAGALAAVPAFAQTPTGASVAAGQVTLTQHGGNLTVNQASQNAIVNWQSFNIGAGNRVDVLQPNSAAAMLARVTGGDPSQLLGQLKADGRFFLINPKGVIVGPNAVIDTGAFMASTIDVSDTDFLRGTGLTFKGDSAAGVVNLGKVTAREGSVLLLAHTVQNAGELNAPHGTVGLGAGTEVLLASPDAGNFTIKFNLPSTSEKTGVDNSGVIAAAQAQLEAAGGSIYELAVNQRGVVRATGVENKNGRILLTAAGGTVGVSGENSAHNANGSGGEILVGGDYRGGNAAVAKAARTVVTATGKLDASATNSAAPAGRVIVWADDSTRFLGTLEARGAGGGFAEVSGKRWLDFNPHAPVQVGQGGTLLLDPDALVISADPNSGTGTSGTNPFTFTASTEPATLNVTTLQNQLAASNVILDTSTSTGDITFNSAVTWSTNNALTVKSGNNINLNADVTGGATSSLALYAGRRATAPSESGQDDVTGKTNLASNATLTVGTLTLGANTSSAPGAGYTLDSPARSGTASLDGNLHVNTLEADLTSGAANILAAGSDNAIGAFRTTGTGTLEYVYLVDHHGGLDVTLNSATAGGPYVQFITPGTLTLKSGSSLDFATPGTALFASTGGAFVNEAGASVFGANTRFLIYSNTTGATEKDGLTGAQVFNHPYDLNDDYSGDALSRFFYTAFSGSPVLTYTADGFTRTYGAANPTLTFTTTGWQGGVANDVTGAPTLSTSATQSSGVGNYTIAIAPGTLASSNYDFSFTPGTLEITRAPLTITANNATRRFDVANPAFTASYAGFVLNETSAVLGGTLSFSSAAAATPGTFPLTPSGLTAANYALSFVPGTLTLTETAALLIAANSFSRTYGAANPTFTASASGFVGGDTDSVITGLQFNTAATQGSGIGNYTITPFGASATGYAISYTPGTLEITRAPLTISVPNQARNYGSANNLFANYNGLVNNETSAVISGLALATDATTASNAGNYPITASGASAANYSISYAQGTLTVQPAPITITVAPATRRYGDADPAFSFSIAGLKNGDPESLIHLTDLTSLASATAGIGAYGIVGSPSTSSGNYSVASQVTGTLTVTPRPLTIAANNATRVYGDANPAFSATFTGLASFDTSALFGSLGLTTQATPSSGVGNWGITFPTVANANYAITSQFGTLSITPAPLTFLPLIELSRIYGHANPALPLPDVGGLKLADTAANLGLAYTTPALNADAGTYTYRLTTTNPNYSLASATGEFRVTPAPLTVAVGPAARLYGDANPASYEVRVNGLAFGQTADSVVSVVNPTETGTDVGKYTLSATLKTGNYYVTSFTGGAFQINPRLLTLDLPYYARYYGDFNPTYNLADIAVGGDGLARFDTIQSLVTDLHTNVATTERTNTGYYRIDPTFAANPNYVYSWTPGYLAIVPRPVEVTVRDGVSFGNNNIPAGFDASALGVNLISLDLVNPANAGTGYSATISNLAWFETGLGATNDKLYFTTSATNSTQKVGVATALGDVYFPARPNRTAPQAASDPLPVDLPFSTIDLVTINPNPPQVDSPLAPLTPGVIFSNGNFVIDPTGTKKDTRFDDVIEYIIPHLSLGGNYVVTKVSNGKLTRKTDPVKMEQTLAAEALVAKRRAAEEALLGGPETPGTISTPGTFGLTRDQYPLIREAFVNMLYDMILAGGEDPFLQALTGQEYTSNINSISNDQILFWLADIHANPAKQALLMPAMVSYGVKLAGLTPAQRTPSQEALVEKMTPFLAGARAEFLDKAVQAQKEWGEVQAQSGNLQALMGPEVPYERFVQNAINETVENSFGLLQAKTAGLNETDTTKLIGAGAAVAGGTSAGLIFATVATSSMESIFPFFKESAMKAGIRSGKELAEYALEKAGTKLTDEVVDRTVQSTTNALRAAKATSTAGGAFAIISVAVSIGIDKAISVAEEGHQKEKFETLLASRNGPIDAYAMSNDQQGRAMLTMGLMQMFGGKG